MEPVAEAGGRWVVVRNNDGGVGCLGGSGCRLGVMEESSNDCSQTNWSTFLYSVSEDEELRNNINVCIPIMQNVLLCKSNSVKDVLKVLE